MDSKYTAKELYKVMLKIINSDKEGGYTSKQMVDIFGHKTKSEIFELDPDMLMNAVKRYDESNVVQGSIVRQCTTNMVGLCTYKAPNSDCATVMWKDGSSGVKKVKDLIVIGRYDFEKILRDIEWRMTTASVKPVQKFVVGDEIRRKAGTEESYQLIASGVKHAVVISACGNDMTVRIVKHENQKYVGSMIQLTNTTAWYEKI